MYRGNAGSESQAGRTISRWKGQSLLQRLKNNSKGLVSWPGALAPGGEQFKIQCELIIYLSKHDKSGKGKPDEHTTPRVNC